MATAALGRETQKKQLENQIAADLREIAQNRLEIQSSQKDVARLAQETQEILRKIDMLLPDPLERLAGA